MAKLKFTSTDNKNFDDILKIATGKDSIKVEPTPETSQLIKTTSFIIGGAITFLAISILLRKR